MRFCLAVFVFAIVGSVLGLPLAISVAQESPSVSAGEAGANSSVIDLPPTDWGEDFQIGVFGSDPTTRAVFLSFCRETQESFRNTLFKHRPGELSRKLPWAIPIKVELWGDASEVFRGDYLRTRVVVGPDNRLLVRLRVKLHDRFDEKAFRLELVRAMLQEQIAAPYAKSPDSLIGKRIQAPEWIAHGFDQLLEHRDDGRPSALYRGILTSGQMMGPSELFAVKSASEFDPLRYEAFRASSSAMVEALLNQPDGESGIRSVLGELGRVQDLSAMEPLFRQHFPAFREMDLGMEKWWALEIAAMGQQQSFEYMSAEETERWLSEALTIRIDQATLQTAAPSKKKNFFSRFKTDQKKNEIPVAVPVESGGFVGPIEDYKAYLGLSGKKEALAASFNRLQRVKQTGFPLYRPVFDRYEVILTKLAEGKTKDIDVDFRETTELRAKIADTLLRAEDFLNYFEAARSPERSKAFEEYLQMRKALQAKPLPRRNDRISEVMDSVEFEILQKGLRETE